MKKINLVLVILVLCHFSKAQNFDLRQVNWGMSQEAVKSSESASLLYSTNDVLMVQPENGSSKIKIKYLFNESDQLIGCEYLSDNNIGSKSEAWNGFVVLNNELVQELGPQWTMHASASSGVNSQNFDKLNNEQLKEAMQSLKFEDIYIEWNKATLNAKLSIAFQDNAYQYRAIISPSKAIAQKLEVQKETSNKEWPKNKTILSTQLEQPDFKEAAFHIENAADIYDLSLILTIVGAGGGILGSLSNSPEIVAIGYGLVVAGFFVQFKGNSDLRKGAKALNPKGRISMLYDSGLGVKYVF